MNVIQLVNELVSRGMQAKGIQTSGSNGGVTLPYGPRWYTPLERATSKSLACHTSEVVAGGNGNKDTVDYNIRMKTWEALRMVCLEQGGEEWTARSYGPVNIH